LAQPWMHEASQLVIRWEALPATGQVGLAVRLSRGLMPLQRMRRVVSGRPECPHPAPSARGLRSPLDGLLHRAPANPAEAEPATLMGFEAGGRSHSPGPHPMGCGHRSIHAGDTDRTHAPPWVTRAAILSPRRAQPMATPSVTHPCTLGHTGRRASRATRHGQTAAPEEKMSTTDLESWRIHGAGCASSWDATRTHAATHRVDP